MSRPSLKGIGGEWRVDPARLDEPFKGRTAILSPFDRLVHDRARLETMFDFRFKLEIYVPVANRRWGYYVLPVLHGDQFVARIDAKADRATGVLRIPALHVEPDTDADAVAAAHAEAARLAAWLGLEGGVAIERTVGPEGGSWIPVDQAVPPSSPSRP